MLKIEMFVNPELRDTEKVSLTEDFNAYFKREVMPHVPDAWINTSICDYSAVGKAGYEINFNRYKYQPPCPLEVIETDIRTLEKEIMGMQRDVAG